MQTKEPQARLPPEVQKLIYEYSSGYLRESELAGAIKASSKHEASKVYNALGDVILILFLLLGLLAYKVNNSVTSTTAPPIAGQVSSGSSNSPGYAVPSKVDPNLIIKYMQNKNYQIRAGLGELNIVYVFNPNFEATINQWSDRRIIFTIRNGKPVIIHDSPATIKGGKPSWNNPPNPKGYPVVVPGQYFSWSVGLHKGKPALAQTRSIPVMRTKDQGKSWQPDQGLFGMNQHRGAGIVVGPWSEGCLVSQSGHEDFMRLMYTDPGYIMNKNFHFPTTIIDGSKL